MRSLRLSISLSSPLTQRSILFGHQTVISSFHGTRGLINSSAGPPAAPQHTSNSASAPIATSTEPHVTKGSISKAMKAYLERAEAHDKFMREQEQEFVFGRRHLANMMGKDPETFTQKDIDESIRYLFPAGLFEPRALPIMRPPAEIYPKQKAAQFDSSGRPHHPFFYTTKPNFFFLIHEIVGKIQELNSISKGAHPGVVDTSVLDGSTWLPKQDLEDKLLERISDNCYDEWINSMDRLASHPLHAKEKDFILSYRKPLVTKDVEKSFPPITLEPDGTQSVCVQDCRKKTCFGTVTVKMPGTGKFDINGKDLDYFDRIRCREQVIFPLQLVDWLGTVDVKVEMKGGGDMAQANVCRFGIATGIGALGADCEKLRLAGLLTIDRRKKERSHVAHTGARAAWTWKKR